MKNSLHNLSIRKKFAVVLIPLIVTIICFDIFQINHNYLDYKDAKRLNKAIIVGIEINHVVHQLQKERGISVGYLVTRGEDFAEELGKQRKTSDSTFTAFYQEIVKPGLKSLITIHGQEIDEVKTILDRVDYLRKQVDDLLLSPKLAIENYSEINAVALNTVSLLINETRDKKLAQQVHAMIYFLKSKEQASVERAVGIQAFTKDTIGYEMYNQLASLVASQEAYMDAFLTICNDESKEYYHSIVTGNDDLEELERMRTILFANDGINEDPEYWYNIKTNKINLLKDVEEKLASYIHTYTENVSSSTFRKFVFFLIVDFFIAGLTLWLIGYIVANLVKNVALLEAYAKNVSSGDISKKVFVPTKDELGQYANTFNAMVEEINKTHRELKKERNHAEYLYENIIKQSEVIFENVDQGIFLLDKDFKISNLYSKEMEKIFDNSKIAGENLSSFMRSRLIPRDLEALEMFMRHLFNTDIDEDVVNQLNPVETVKVFTETDGIVNTKYIRFSFSRIGREGEIQSILVTVLDETESVLLQQHLEEANAQKKQEMEQMLSILKIDPALLRGFIHNSRKELKKISERYEDDKNQNFEKLLNYTFQTIHNLKGNSLVIGLELMCDKFHEIEESIIKLQNKKSKVTGKDFLALLYEVNEVDLIIEKMNEMLRKVAYVYNKFSSENIVDANFALIDLLKRGLDAMGEKTGKAAELGFDNKKNLPIPKRYETPFKDVMIQLIRNSIAHGIEPPNIRVAKRKLIKGSITISLDQSENGDMMITYRDDGQGLDLDEIRKKAVSKNLISEEEAHKLNEKQALELIFKEGFSTADGANTHAGRGQGMCLVKSIIDEQEGTFEVNFKKGHFFEMIIKFPIVQNGKLEVI